MVRHLEFQPCIDAGDVLQFKIWSGMRTITNKHKLKSSRAEPTLLAELSWLRLHPHALHTTSGDGWDFSHSNWNAEVRTLPKWKQFNLATNLNPLHLAFIHFAFCDFLSETRPDEHLQELIEPAICPQRNG